MSNKTESQPENTVDHAMTSVDLTRYTVMVEGVPVVVEAYSVGEASELALAQVAESKNKSEDTAEGGKE